MRGGTVGQSVGLISRKSQVRVLPAQQLRRNDANMERRCADMAILMPDLTVEVYNADYRVLSRIPWQEAVRLILRGAVYIIDVHTPAVHIHSPSVAIELPVSVALREDVQSPYKPDTRG